MNKEFETFYQKDVVPALDRALEEVNEIYRSQSTIEGKRFHYQFREICSMLKKYMSLNEFRLAYICFNLLRTRLIKKNYKYAVYVYDKSYYLKDGIHMGDLDVSFLFQPYNSLWDELLKESRKYIGKVSVDEVRDLMLFLSERFHEYVVEFLRLQMKKVVEMEEYMSIEREWEVEIASGEFFEPCDLIYLESRKKVVTRIRKKLCTPKNGKWLFRDFRGVDLTEMMLSDCDFRYADFSGAKLNQARFEYCLLDGARFENANLQGGSFNGALLNDVDFNGADLRDSSFHDCISNQGRDSINDWRSISAIGSSFQNANLERANFQNALIRGGDFTKANLKDVKFENAFLSGSSFNRNSISEGMFTKEQQEQICIV